MLEEIKASALELQALPASAAAAIRRLDIEQLSVEALSDAVVHSFAGDSNFPCWRCSIRIFANVQRAGCPIYKIYGSVRASAGLVDTVSQKLRGLSFPVRARLIDLYHVNHILVVGFSGADLALSALKSSGKGITWIVEPARTLNPHAQAAVESVSGTRAEATLAEVFEALGAYSAKSAPVCPASAAQSESDARARARIRQWVSELGGGPPCIFASSWPKTLDGALAVDLQWRGSILPLNAVVVFNNLATGAHLGRRPLGKRTLGFAGGQHVRGVRATSPDLGRAGESSRKAPDDSAIDRGLDSDRPRARWRGDIKGAREAFARARQAAEEIGDTNARSTSMRHSVCVVKVLPLSRRLSWRAALGVCRS